jgi:4-hydroxy-tetrahydrodipicolinate synthase
MTQLPGGSWTALVTPFRDGVIDDSALTMLALRQLVNGSAGLVVCGSTGEAASLSQAEYARAIAIVAQAVGDEMPVVAGCTQAATADAVLLAETAAHAGATGLLCAAPPYVRPTQDGLFAHLRAIAHSVDIPIIAYDIPARTGVMFTDETIARLAEAGHIAAIKDATADLSRPPRLGRLCGPALLQLSGDDATAAGYRAMGGDGCISVTANVVPALCAQLHAAWRIGDLPRFEDLRDRLAPLHAALFAESNPIPVKAALGLLGLCEPHTRAPLTRATEATVTRLRAVLAANTAADQTDRIGRAARLSLVM